ncbi:MAG: hypothetical protein Phog2KO_44320 [Phototrophicaceae bacterium]
MFRKILIICSVLISVTFTATARDVLSDDICIVAEDETIDGTLFAFCEELYIDGTVDGDIFGATVRTVINGEVNGSLYMVGGQLDIYGTVEKDIHYAGAVLRVNPITFNESDEVSSSDELIIHTTRSIKALTLSTTLSSATLVEDGVINVGYQLIMNGDIASEVSFWGSTFVLNGLIDGNVYAVVGDPQSDSSQIETLLLPLNFDLSLLNPGLIVGADSEITGLLSYRGPIEGEIQGLLAQDPNYVPPDTTVLTLAQPNFLILYFEALGREFSTLAIIGILILFFASNFLQAPVANLRTRPFASLGVGLLGFLLSFPIILIVLVLSLSLLGFLFIIGFRGVVIAIALVLGLVNIGGASIFYFVAIFVTRALVGLAIGRLTLRLVFKRQDVDEHRWLQYVALILGVLIIAVLISLPIIGIILNAMTLFLGLGAILNVVLAQFSRFRNTPSVPRATWYTPSPSIIRERHFSGDLQQASLSPQVPPIPTAMLDSQVSERPDDVPAPGSENLPDGFDWDFFED